MPELIQFSESDYLDRGEMSMKDCLEAVHPDMINWINLEGTEGPDFDLMVEQLHLHHLMVEDIRNRFQLPKFEHIDHISFLSLQMIHRHPISHEILNEHLSILVGDRTVFTVQEKKAGDVFNNLRNRIKLNHKRLARNGVDYLFLAFVDSVVDEYLAIIDGFRLPIEDLEMTMVKRPTVVVMKKIMEHKSKLNEIRRLTVPLREELQRIRTENPELIKKNNYILFRDIQDHMNTLVINFENFREMLRDLVEMHHSNQNLQLNNTMKTLTVISAIFIPLTFIVGVYGMNFKHFPELEWQYGYLWIWLVMLCISGGMVVYMKRKKWF